MRGAESTTAGWMPMKKYKIVVLDDYQNVALESADWSMLRDQADIAVFQDHLAEPDAVIERLLPFDVVCVMRERTPLPRNVIERLPNLKLIASTGAVNASIDVAAAGDHGIAVVHTGYRSDPTIEFTWALILASARHIVTESNSVRSGGWQQTVGTDLRGKTLGVLGLGNVGSQVARVGTAFGMKLIAWSQNMTPEASTATGVMFWLQAISFIPKAVPTRATCDPTFPSPRTPRVFPRRSVPTVCCQPPDRTELLSVTI